jgi:hypothetical protein
MIKRRMKQRLNWIAVQHRARMVLKYFFYGSNYWINFFRLNVFIIEYGKID